MGLLHSEIYIFLGFIVYHTWNRYFLCFFRPNCQGGNLVDGNLVDGKFCKMHPGSCENAVYNNIFIVLKHQSGINNNRNYYNSFDNLED